MISTSNARYMLQQLIIRAEQLLDARGSFVTNGAKRALQDALNQAYKAMDSNDEVPFHRNREFLVPRDDEAIHFATRRFTMVPPFQEGGVYALYGLEPAITWFENQNILRGGGASIPEKAKFALEKVHQFLSAATLGDAVGNYDPEKVQPLMIATQALEKELGDYDPDIHGEIVAQKIVELYNCLDDLRNSRRLRTDLEPDSSLYLSSKKMKKLRADVHSGGSIQERYKNLERWTELYSLEDLEKAVDGIMHGCSDYEDLNKHFYLWSHTDKIINFKAPSETVKASLSFVLPSEENETEGLGHVWIDDVAIWTAHGKRLDIWNGGFDDGTTQPDHWSSQARRGKPILKWEQTYPYCGGEHFKEIRPSDPSVFAYGDQHSEGKRSIYLCNPTSEDEGAWVYDHMFAVEQGTQCTLTFSAKLDGKLKKGLRVVITFLDSNDRAIGEHVYVFNRKSSLSGSRFQLAMQADATRYAMTGDIYYAIKTKFAMLYILNDFCQGAEHWMVTNLRPEGNDAYGAVQGGRVLSVLAVSYSLIRQADVFELHEKEQFHALIEYMLRYLLDLRDRTEWSAEEAQRGCSNWQTDMSVGTSFMMMALSDFPNRHVWLNNANTILRSQLELNVNSDGSWPESIRYHHAALERFAGYATVLKNVTGEDWFLTTPIARMFEYGIDMQTPGYSYFDGKIGTPPFGDHALGDGSEFGYYGVFHAAIVEVDQQLADRMYHTWDAAGKPLKKWTGEGVAFENLLTHIEEYVPKTKLHLNSCMSYPDAGIYLFRKNFGIQQQSYFAIMSSPRPVAHGHLDQGSFILYKNSIPLVMDSGIEGYFDSSTHWHLSSYSHACLQFATRKRLLPADDGGMINLSAGTFSLERGWVDVPKSSRVLLVKLGGEVESITIEITNPEGSGRHIRHVAYVPACDVYIIRDEIADYEGQVLFNLPVAATGSTLRGHRILSKGVESVDLETIFLSPLESITLEQGRTTRFYDRKDEHVPMMDYVRAVADAKKGFWTVLYPKEKGQKELTVTYTSEDTIHLSTERHQVMLDINSWTGTKGFNLNDDTYRLHVRSV